MKLAVTAPERLAVRTVPVPDPGDLIARLPHPTALAWIRHGEGIAGWGEAARIPVPGGADRFAAAAALLRELFAAADVDDPVDVPGTGPVAFGSFGFDPESPDSTLIVPRRILGRRDGTAWLTTIGDDTEPLAVPTPPHAPAGLRWQDGALPEDAWRQAVAAAVGRIRDGHLGKVVLARDLTARADAPIDARVLLRRLADRFPGCYTFSCDGLVGATPELLIRRTGDDIESLVLAGTTARGTDPADDRARAARLFNSAQGPRRAPLRRRHGPRRPRTPLRRTHRPRRTRTTHPPQPHPPGLPRPRRLTPPLRPRRRRRAPPHPRRLRNPHRHRPGPHPRTGEHGPRPLRRARRLGRLTRRRRMGHRPALRQIDGPSARLFAGGGIVADSDPDAELAEARTKFGPMQYAIHG